MPWKKISSKSVYKNKWMEVTEDIVETPSGKTLNFGVVHKNPFALIIPWDGKYLTIVEQYRYPIDSLSWEFPMGHLEGHSSISDAAKGELEEEAGFRAENIKEVATFFLGPGHHTQACHVFLATGLSKGEQKLEDSEEGMKVKKVTIEELGEMIRNGEIKDGPTITAFGIAINNNLLK